MDRFDVLRDLVAFSKPLDVLSNTLSKFDWDYGGSPLVVTASDMKAVLNLFLVGERTAEELESWGNLIECREDLYFEEKRYKEIENVIYFLANPVLQGRITPDSCKELLATLDR